METNVCALDRTVRLALGIALAVVGVVIVAGIVELGVAVGGVALLAGLVLIGTGAMQLCPIYSIVGIDTCDRN